MRINIISLLLFILTCCAPSKNQQEELPNILWITSEDMNAFIGAFGDELAITPNLDRLAEEGVMYTHAFATAPVCSPSRSCLITGVYATSMGTQHLRSEVNIPPEIIPFPKLLREKGYYCTNNEKEDYNFQDNTIWDESSGNAHWRNRAEGQAFFSVFNFETTHQSRVFGSDSVFYERFGKQLADEERHLPSQMKIPSYHFDSPVVRKLWARYYDLITIMDKQLGSILEQLEADGLREETIIFYYADHGTGMPRSKRAAYDSGLRVPLIIWAPEKWQKKLNLLPGTKKNDLVSFVDFAPTILSLTGIDIPEYMQGKAFLGPEQKQQEFVFGHSDRVDEAFEITRTVRDKKYRYVRNYLPMLPLIQRNFYTDQSEIMKELYRLKSEKTELSPAQKAMWEPRRKVEELYDTVEDPDEIDNLAELPEYQEILSKMRKEHESWVRETYDSGLMPENLMNQIDGFPSVYNALRDPNWFPLDKIMEISLMTLTKPDIELLIPFLEDPNPAVKYWAITAIDYLDPKEINFDFYSMIENQVPIVQLAAIDALGRRGELGSALTTLLDILNGENEIERLYAARILELHLNQLKNIPEELTSFMAGNCPETDWNNYYSLYTCWALNEGLKEFQMKN